MLRAGDQVYLQRTVDRRARGIQLLQLPDNRWQNVVIVIQTVRHVLFRPSAYFASLSTRTMAQFQRWGRFRTARGRIRIVDGEDFLTGRRTSRRHDFRRGATDGWGRIYFVTPATGIRLRREYAKQ